MEVDAQFLSGSFTYMEKTSYVHWLGGLLGPRTRLDAVKKTKISYSCLKPNLDISIHSLVAIPTELPEPLNTLRHDRFTVLDEGILFPALPSQKLNTAT
jgi:hypothetical protein